MDSFMTGLEILLQYSDDINWTEVGLNAINFAVATTATGRITQTIVNVATGYIGSRLNGDSIEIAALNAISSGTITYACGSGAAFGDRLKNVWNVQYRLNRINYTGATLKAANRMAAANFTKESVKSASMIAVGYSAGTISGNIISCVSDKKSEKLSNKKITVNKKIL